MIPDTGRKEGRQVGTKEIRTSRKKGRKEEKTVQ